MKRFTTHVFRPSAICPFLGILNGVGKSQSLVSLREGGGWSLLVGLSRWCVASQSLDAIFFHNQRTSYKYTFRTMLHSPTKIYVLTQIDPRILLNTCTHQDFKRDAKDAAETVTPIGGYVLRSAFDEK